MQLYTTCHSCKKEINIFSFANTRPDLEMDKGEVLSLNCKHCGSFQSTHVNEVKAKVNSKYVIMASIISAIVTIILLGFLGLIGTFTILIPLLVYNQEKSNVRAFNIYSLPRI